MNTPQTLFGLWENTGFYNATSGNLIMILVGIALVLLAIRYSYKPLLLIPLGMGIILGNIPFLHEAAYHPGIYQDGSVLNYLFFGVLKGIYPALIFLGLGAMTDLSPLISNPKLMLLGAAAQVGIFVSFLGAMVFGFPMAQAAAIAIIGGADGNTAIFLTSQLAGGLHATGKGLEVQNLIGPIAIAAYIYMSLVPVIQPPIMKLLTTRKERLIRMKPPRTVSKFEKILFPLLGLLLSAFVAPASLPLLGMFFFGNILKESGLTKQLAATASTKVMNIFLKKENRINPIVGAAGVSAVPDSARIAHEMGLREDPTNHLIGHAMAPNIAGLIGSAITAGLLLGFLL